MASAALLALGFLVGTIGTLIGLGGGFILLPVLLVMYPDAQPEALTAVSLAAVAANATSGTIAYARMKRIEYRTAVLFALATIPGAIAGSFSTSLFERSSFEVVLGLVMIAGAVFLVLKRTVAVSGHEPGSGSMSAVVSPGARRLGTMLSVGVGYVSSLLGIGGGIVHVPVMIKVLRFPVHLATATSHFVLMVMAIAAVVTHVVTKSYEHDAGMVLLICAGTVIGAQVGARLSNRIHADWIVRILAVAMAFFGIKLIVGSL